MTSTEVAMTTEHVSVIRPSLKVLRQRAPRLCGADVPWISTVRLPWGLELCLLNISSSGILVETSSKFTPGTIAELQLLGPDGTLAVPARFLRSEVVEVDGRGVRYHAAAAFEKQLDLARRNESRPVTWSMSAVLADWLRQLSAEIEAGADCGLLLERIDQGLRRLAGVRDVRIGKAPVAPQEGCESLCFNVAKGSASSVLQATFDPGQLPSELDFKLLQAGAALAAVVLAIRHDGSESDRPVPVSWQA